MCVGTDPASPLFSVTYPGTVTPPTAMTPPPILFNRIDLCYHQKSFYILCADLFFLTQAHIEELLTSTNHNKIVLFGSAPYFTPPP